LKGFFSADVMALGYFVFEVGFDFWQPLQEVMSNLGWCLALRTFINPSPQLDNELGLILVGDMLGKSGKLGGEVDRVLAHHRV